MMPSVLQGRNLFFGKIYDKIGFSKIQSSLLRDLVISWITHLGSKLSLSNFLKETGRRNVSVYSIYRFLYKLNSSLKNEIETISFNYTKKLLGGLIGVVFYDMTTIYSEASEPDDFRVPGFSKEVKHQNPLVMLGLLVGKDGYPIGCELFEGNTFEGHTLIPVLERYLKRFKLEKPIVVADSGLLSKANIEQLSENGYQFIMGTRIKNEATSVKKQVVKLELQNGQFAITKRTDGLKLHIGYSDKRAKKDRFNRDRELKKLEKNLASGKLTKANINNRGYHKFLKLEGEISISIDNEKLEQDQRWDGLKGYLTNTTLQSSDLVDNYNNLWKIEKAFSISKTDLKIRPVYLRLKERIQAHICISFMACLVYKELERLLNTNNSTLTINMAVDNINRMQEVTTGKNIPIR